MQDFSLHGDMVEITVNAGQRQTLSPPFVAKAFYISSNIPVIVGLSGGNGGFHVPAETTGIFFCKPAYPSSISIRNPGGSTATITLQYLQ